MKDVRNLLHHQTLQQVLPHLLLHKLEAPRQYRRVYRVERQDLLNLRVPHDLEVSDLHHLLHAPSREFKEGAMLVSAVPTAVEWVVVRLTKNENLHNQSLSIPLLHHRILLQLHRQIL
jgi:hypothetical protein